jgi:hypothetical protein
MALQTSHHARLDARPARYPNVADPTIVEQNLHLKRRYPEYPAFDTILRQDLLGHAAAGGIG